MKFTFIEPELSRINRKKKYPASYVRKEFQITKPINSAVMFTTALGVYELHFNGEQVGQELLSPGFTNYDRRLQYQEHDITTKIRMGKNIIGCLLGDGWYRGNVGAFNKKYVFGEKIKFACTLVLLYEDGTREHFCTDKSWRATQHGPLRENDLKIVELYDARKELHGWMEPGYDDSDKNGWHHCQEVGYNGELCQAIGEKVIEKERFQGTVIQTPNGESVLDFGQNISGHVEFAVKGSAGHEVSLVMGEALDEQGNFTLKNLQGEGKSAEVMPVGQRLNYILKQGEQSYKSKFLISGYRYVQLNNWPEKVKAENFTSIAVYSDLCETGDFTCSHPLINKFVKNVRWSQKSNFVDIPTDCPQRERAGWAGDINVFIETANYLTDTRKFISKWMKDFVGAQEKNGALPYIIPEVPAIGAGKSSAGWSDAIAEVPLAQYLFYGEIEEITAAYETVKRFVNYNRGRARRRHLFHIYRIEPYFNYILDTGFHYGEWLEPGGSNIKDALKAMIIPDAEVATAWFYYTTKNLVTMAELLGNEADKEEYSALATKIRDAYRREFLKSGNVLSHRQCRYVRPLYMGLTEKSENQDIAKRLNDLCIANQYKIGTGFLTTYKILHVLSDYGYVDTAYKMLENEECPGWLYEIKQGATTVWEGWDAFKDGKLNPLSLNHYAPGAIVSWLFSHCAGIKSVEPGFKKIEIRPLPGGSLSYAKAEFNSIKGKIVSDWRIEGQRFYLSIIVPEGTEAKVILPDGAEYENAKSGTYECAI